MQGWGAKHLLPLDPFAWSNEEGTLNIRKEDVKLPSQEWIWQGDWKFDTNIKGFQTDTQVAKP